MEQIDTINNNIEKDATKIKSKNDTKANICNCNKNPYDGRIKENYRINREHTDSKLARSEDTKE